MGAPGAVDNEYASPDVAARGIAGRGTETPAVADRGLPDEAEQRRADYLDAFRASLTQLFTDTELARDDVSIVLVRARGMEGNLAEGHGPRTAYVNAANLLTVYLHLVQRAAKSARDRDGALLETDSWGRTGPWTAERPKCVEEIPIFNAKAIQLWNEIVAGGKPPDYDPGRRRGRRGSQRPAALTERRRTPGIYPGRPKILELPFGLRAVVNAGGPDARLMYSIIKTPAMTLNDENGKAAILEAVIGQILRNKHDASYYAEKAREMLRRDYGSSKDVLYSNAPNEEFEKRSPGMEFTFEVGMGFLMNLDEITGGAVPMSLLRELEPGIEIKKDEPKPLWQELYPNATAKEKAYWVWKRMQDALPLWDASLGRPKPGAFYPGNRMFYVSDGMFAGDQIWVTEDLRIYQVNERAALLEAFRVGVLQAAGAVMLGYIMMALAPLLVEAPAILAMGWRLVTVPKLVAEEFLLVLRTRPLTILADVAIDQGVNLILAGGWDNYKKNVGGAGDFIGLFFTLLMSASGILKLPSGAKLEVKGGALHLLPDTAVAGAAPTPGTHADLAPGAAVPAAATPPATTPVGAMKGATADAGSAVVVRPDAPPVTTGAAPRRASDVASHDPGAVAADAAGTPAPARALDDATPSQGRAGADAARASGPEQTAVNAESRGVPDRDADIDAPVESLGGGGRGRPRPRGKKTRGRRDPPNRDPMGGRGKARGRRGSGPPQRRGGGRGTPDETITFESDGITYRVTVSAEARRAYDAIPLDNTVVYTVHDASGSVVYVGITKKTSRREALTRLREHLRTKEGVFISDANEFRIVGHYEDPMHAHALEQSIVTHERPRYNLDTTPWLTYQDFYLSRRLRIESRARGVDIEMKRGTERLRERPIPDWEGNVPDELNNPIRFDLE